ncbi:methyltransferase family protein [Granulosicoccus antarcticus]|uniref:methyltransferase family protein n=1 Tax=Granulosicoccus antarcticus TaxID=437505 RepID=UPI0012FD27E9|nr:isoprenylcysteine carboxylmethyltransferase family protein [Granulosicoccus antarcticus]
MLTRPSIKNRLPAHVRHGYRLAYNIVSAIHFLLVYLIGRALLDQSRFDLSLSNPAAFLYSLLSIGGVIVILLALRQYDLGLFSGISQLLKKNNPDGDVIEPLNTAGLNRWIRHPLYTGAFMYLWGGANSQFGLWTAIFASAYLLIGVHYEERKLIAVYGDAYINYKASVSKFLPLKF